MPLPRLWAALQPHDPTTGRPRGYLLLSRPPLLPHPLEGQHGAATTGQGPSLLFSLDKARYAEWPALRDWLLSLHLQHASGGITSAVASVVPLWGDKDDEGSGAAAAGEGGFRRFLATLPPRLATLITPLPAVAAVLAQEGGGTNGDGNGGNSSSSSTSPQAALKRLVAAIEVMRY